MAKMSKLTVDIVVRTKAEISLWDAIKLRIAGEAARLKLIEEAVAKAAKPVQNNAVKKAETMIKEQKNDRLP
jgi:hypothetical protein